MSNMTSDEGKSSKISLKTKLILGGVALFVILLIVANVQKSSSDDNTSSLVDDTTTAQLDSDGEGLSDAELEQQGLISTFGQPPEGFRWNDVGEPVAVSDEGLTAEEVAYQYLRSLSMLNFETARKYSYISMTANVYDSYFGVDASQSYYTQFVRKLYSQALLSLQIEGMDHEAVFANGKRICTFNISIIDLSYKDFWESNAEEFYKQLFKYQATEKDTTKAQNYVFDKILEYFSSEDAKRKTVQIDLVLDKVTLGGWLVSDDTDLEMLCEYADGTSVYEYMMEQYSVWADNQNK